MGQTQRQEGGRRNLDDYVGVHVRVEKFRAEHKGARILTQIIKDEPLTVRAEVYFEDNDTGIPNGVGHADEGGGMGNRGRSALEMTETAAVGRALAFCGYEVKQGIASREEMEREQTGPRPVPASDQEKPQYTNDPERIKLTTRVRKLCQDLGYSLRKQEEAMSKLSRKSKDDIRKTVIPSLEKLLAKKREQNAAPAQDDEQQKEAANLRSAIYRELNRLYKTEEEINGFLAKNHGGKKPEEMSLAELRKMAADMEVK